MRLEGFALASEVTCGGEGRSNRGGATELTQRIPKGCVREEGVRQGWGWVDVMD